MVIAPAKTGNDSNSRIVVINTDHTNKGIFSIVIFFWRIFIIVEIKLIDPRIDETPAKCREKIVRSTEAPLWDKFLERGG